MLEKGSIAMTITPANGWVAVFRSGPPDNPVWETRPVVVWQEYADGEVQGLIVDNQGNLQPGRTFASFYRYELNDTYLSSDGAAPLSVIPDSSSQIETDGTDRVMAHESAAADIPEQNPWATKEVAS
jgi:hypothetical protein